MRSSLSLAALLAMGLLLAFHACQAAPMDSPVPENYFADLQCGRGLVGGWSPVDVNSEDLSPLAGIALRHYSRNSLPLQACAPNSIASAEESIKVLSACKQVVAGMNYAIVFEVTFPCTNGPDQTQTLFANVYEPLPSSNELPRVLSVAQIAQE